MEVRESTIHVGDGEVSASRLTLTGEEVVVGEGTQLRAEQASGGGTIEVGGSWQNRDETVRQAKRTVVEAGALLDASAGDVGDGGEIVVWSEVASGDGMTDVAGVLLASAGKNSGDGGRIETSGATLLLSKDLRVEASSAYGVGGLWLQDA